MAETCPTCGASFGSGADLIEHTTEAHADSGGAGWPSDSTPHRILRCAVCAASFTTTAAFAAHNVRPHPVPGTRRRGAWSLNTG